MIIGGAYQGKLTLAAREYGLTPGDICDLAAGEPAPGTRCYIHLEELTRRQEDTESYLPLLTAAEVVIAREIGSGVVPMDAGERAWRERHAQTEGSLRNLYYGAADIPALPESLSELHRRAGDYPTAQRYYTSGMLRTEQTLAAIYGNVPHTRLPGLREMDFGDFEMKSYEELKDTPAYQAWITDVEHNPCPHGESAPQVLRRSLAAIAPVVQRPEDAVCVIHGGVTAGLMMAWFGGGRYDYSVSPGQGFQVTFREGQPVSYTRIPAAE